MSTFFRRTLDARVKEIVTAESRPLRVTVWSTSRDLGGDDSTPVVVSTDVGMERHTGAVLPLDGPVVFTLPAGGSLFGMSETLGIVSGVYEEIL